MKAEFNGELVGAVQWFHRAELLLCGHAIYCERRGLKADRRCADLPMDVCRLHGPPPGQLIFGTCANRPPAMLMERDIRESVDRERGRGRRRGKITATQLRITGRLPAMEQKVVLQIETQSVVRTHSR